MSIVEIYDSESDDRVLRDPLDDLLDPKPRKGKNGKNNNIPVETEYRGFTLEKARPVAGEGWSWGRIGQKPLRFDQKHLIEAAKTHRRNSKKTITEQLRGLSQNQQGVVDRLIDDHNRVEKNKNANWILEDVQKNVKWGWSTKEVTKLQVIIKRVDRYRKSFVQDKDGKGRRGSSKGLFDEDDIIDLLDEPVKKKGKDTKKGKDNYGGGKNKQKLKKHKSYDDMDELPDPLLGLGLGEFSTQQPKRQNSHANSHFQQHQQQDFMPPPPQQPPPGAIPIGAIPINHMPPQMQPPQMHPPYPVSARQSSHELPHPFTPYPHVPAPPAPEIESPGLHGVQWPHPHQHPPQHQHQGRIRARSFSTHERHPSARRPSMDGRRLSRHDDREEELQFRMQNWDIGDDESVESLGEGAPVFSPSPSEPRSFTPPSSPRSYYSDARQRSSLERRKSTSSRQPRYRPRYRSQSFQDVEVEPAYTYRHESRRSRGRIGLRRAQTYDDYPDGRGAEPRYLPAPNPPRVVQRRLTEYGDRFDDRELREYEHERDRDRDRGRERDMLDYRRRPSKVDPFQAAYEQGRMDQSRQRRDYYD